MAGFDFVDASEKTFKRSASTRSKRSKSARKAGVKLPVIQSARRSGESLDMFEDFRTGYEREKFASLKEARMLDDKHIHSSVRELKFKANLPRMQGLSEIESVNNFESHALSGLQDLKEQLEKSQLGVISLETRATKRSKSARAELNQFKGEESNFNMLQRRFQKIRSGVLDEAVADQALPALHLPPLHTAR